MKKRNCIYFAMAISFAVSGIARAQSWPGGTIYPGVKFGAENNIKILEHLMSSADNGSPIAENYLGYLYDWGAALGLHSQDQKEATSFWEFAAAKGFPVAQANLKYFTNLWSDHAEAAKLFGSAAEQGYAPAEFNLGLYYADGREGTPQDGDKAIQLYKLAAAQGFPPALFNLGVRYGAYYEPADQAEAVQLYKLAADRGLPEAQRVLGEYYDEGFGGLPKDQVIAARLFKLAADQGDSDAQVALGVYYDYGLGGLPKNQMEAARLYALAARQADVNGCVNLAIYEFYGLGGLKKDESRAADLYRLAVDNGFGPPDGNLAEEYYSVSIEGLPPPRLKDAYPLQITMAVHDVAESLELNFIRRPVHIQYVKLGP